MTKLVKATNLLKTLAVFSVLALTSTAFADTVSYTGNTETNADGSWIRPNVAFNQLDTDTTLYSVQAFSVSADGMYDISSAQGFNSDKSPFDGMIFLYADAFDPSQPFLNGLAADDDGPEGVTTSLIEGISLSAGTTYYLVTTGFSATDTAFGSGSGMFENTISGDGDITLEQVPLPAAVWLLLSGLAGLRLMRKRQ